jgi:hypothetical protein
MYDEMCGMTEGPAVAREILHGCSCTERKTIDWGNVCAFAKENCVRRSLIH